jgi:Rrf2 family cysteine metabolism transcriptional repressor
MRLSKRTEYGLRAIVQLARLQPNVYVQSKDLSSGQEKLPAKFLEAVLAHLRHGGLLDSRVGSKGGYRLAKPPREIIVGEVIRNLEERLTRKEESVSTELSQGQIACRLLNQNLNSAIDHALNGMTLEELMNELTRANAESQEMYYI